MPPETAPRGWPPAFGASPAEREALLALAHAGVTPHRLHALAWAEGSARGVLAAVVRGAAGEAARAAAAAARPTEARRALAACGARMLVAGEGGFPHGLLDLPDPPAWLFVRGGLAEAPAAAVVGARRCSAYGRDVAEALGRGLAEGGACVVSGAARGVDGAAHRGALAGGGPTVAVLGSGIDVPYPAANRALIERVAEAGAVVSEYPPGAPALRHRFPARNRIVAALGVALVVVEGAEGSGSLITAEFALELGRDVLAVPGPVTSPLSAAPHALLAEGAAPARGPADVLGVLGLSPPPAGAAGEALPEPERRVLAALAGEPVTADAVAAASGEGLPAALSALASLEVRGLVREEGGRYVRAAAGALRREGAPGP